jgi:hypothetical protein
MITVIRKPAPWDGKNRKTHTSVVNGRFYYPFLNQFKQNKTVSYPIGLLFEGDQPKGNIVPLEPSTMVREDDYSISRFISYANK